MFFKLQRKWQIVILATFLGFQLFVYLFGLASNFDWFWRGLWQWNASDAVFFIRYTSTLMCFVFLLMLVRNYKRDLFMVLGFFAIVVADYFLVFRVEIINFYPLGVSAFIVAQIFFMFRFYINMTRKQKILDLITSISILVITLAITIIAFRNSFDTLFFVVAVYFSMLLSNAILAWFQNKTNLTLALGFTFFVLCDIFVGAMYLNWIWFAGTLAWLFYIPCKVLLVLSLLHKPTQPESEPVTKQALNTG